MAHVNITVGDIEAVIGDNAAHEEHRAGYNGVWSLKHRTGTRNLFVPTVAGLNYEHIISGEHEERREVFFEPRNAPMELKVLSETAVELYQPPTPTFFLESWTTFELKAPHYIDMTYRCRATQHVFDHGYIGLFWASYMNAPEDKSMYFPGYPREQADKPWVWRQLCTQAHNRDSTVRHPDDTFEMQFAEGAPDALYKNHSPMRFHEPFFYGLFENHLFLVMLDRTEGIRLTHSPSGGGGNPERRTTNPAWDFQFIIPDYEIMKEYSYRARAVFRERCSREEVLREFQDWRSSL